jgi:hypothetical protein
MDKLSPLVHGLAVVVEGGVVQLKRALVAGEAQTAQVHRQVHGVGPAPIRVEVPRAHGVVVRLAGGVVRINRRMGGMFRCSV